MPQCTPVALRLAIQEHAPHLLVDFDSHWLRVIGPAFEAAFMRLWWTEYAIVRDPGLEERLHVLEARAAGCEDPAESVRLLAEYSRLRRGAWAVEPGH
ncbi:hypothetical protein OG553_21015 [Streptomyces sp. NBC_00158]